MIFTFINFDSLSFIQEFADGNEVLQHLTSVWVQIFLFAFVLCFIIGELTNNLSQVDKVWSIMPVIYGIVTLAAFPFSLRLWIMTSLVTLWGIRLSYNFYRKGGYHIVPWKGEEDYRWGVLRKSPMLAARWKMFLFNLLFISFYQQLLILLFSSPLLLAAKYADNTALTITDFVAAAAMLGFIILETVADNQLYDFHQQKKQLVPSDGRFKVSLEKGFMTDGLWKYVRHPNFAAEQGIWISFYFFATAASGEWFNGTITGAFLLVLLFSGSSGFTESISSSKYPAYDTYKKLTPRFIPLKIKNQNE